MHFYLFFNLIFQEYDVVWTVVAMVHIRSPELTYLITGSFYLGHIHTESPVYSCFFEFGLLDSALKDHTVFLFLFLSPI